MEVLILQVQIFFELALKKWKSFYTFKVYEVSKFYYKLFLDIMIFNEISNSSRCTIE